MINQIAIDFHKWMLANDTIANAEKWANFTDKDMFNEFLVANPTHISYTNISEYMKMLETQVLYFRSGKIVDKESFANMCLAIIEEWRNFNEK